MDFSDLHKVFDMSITLSILEDEKKGVLKRYTDCLEYSVKGQYLI